ncbi:5-oxoprolinase subunit PxpA [soil metagenome]
MDLNADLGEGAGTDSGLLALVTSANVACGAHAGSEATMRDTVRLARDASVAVGAHPGYPDREGFGRREVGATPEDIELWTREQIETLLGICDAEHAELRYVKPHGAMYNRAVRDSAAAAAIAAATYAVNPTLMMLGPAGSALLNEAASAGLRTAAEAFLDRNYTDDGTLLPRGHPDALLTDPAVAAERALLLARGEPISSADGQPLLITADSLCVHSDSPTAVAIATAAHSRLRAEGIPLAPFAR